MMSYKPSLLSSVLTLLLCFSAGASSSHRHGEGSDFEHLYLYTCNLEAFDAKDPNGDCVKDVVDHWGHKDPPPYKPDSCRINDTMSCFTLDWYGETFSNIGDPTECGECLKVAADGLERFCPRSRGGQIWVDKDVCYLRYELYPIY